MQIHNTHSKFPVVFGECGSPSCKWSQQRKGIVMQLNLRLMNFLQFVRVREAGEIEMAMSNQVLSKYI
jgi:hypothetical protein